MTRILCSYCEGDGKIPWDDTGKIICPTCEGEGWVERTVVQVSPIAAQTPVGTLIQSGEGDLISITQVPSSNLLPPVVKAPQQPHSGTMPNPPTPRDPTIPEKYQVHVMYDDVFKKIGSPVLSPEEALVVCSVYPDVHESCYGTTFTGDFFLTSADGRVHIYTEMPQGEPFWLESK